jgi:hypothetical protein
MGEHFPHIIHQPHYGGSHPEQVDLIVVTRKLSCNAQHRNLAQFHRHFEQDTNKP